MINFKSIAQQTSLIIATVILLTACSGGSDSGGGGGTPAATKTTPTATTPTATTPAATTPAATTPAATTAAATTPTTTTPTATPVTPSGESETVVLPVDLTVPHLSGVDVFAGRNGEDFSIHVYFTEAVMGLATTGLTLNNLTLVGVPPAAAITPAESVLTRTYLIKVKRTDSALSTSLVINADAVVNAQNNRNAEIDLGSIISAFPALFVTYPKVPDSHNGLEAFKLDVLFSRHVRGFADSDISVAGGNATVVIDHAGGRLFTLKVTPTTNTTEAITLTIAENAAQDLRHKSNAASALTIPYFSPFELAANGKTIVAKPGTAVGDKGLVDGLTDGVEYTYVDRALLISMRDNGEDLSRVVTTGITDMAAMFANHSAFNSDIGSWDVSSVSDMRTMFSGASDFNADISRWAVSSVTDMSTMFQSAAAFNQDISGWMVGQVTLCSGFSLSTSADWIATHKPTFLESSDCYVTPPPPPAPFAFAGNGHTIVARDGLAVGAKGMLNGVEYTYVDRAMLISMRDNSGDLSRVVTTGITNMQRLFERIGFTTEDISRWDTSSVTNMSNMFSLTNFNPDISRWDVSRVENMGNMFFDNRTFNQDISGWDVSRVNIMLRMFINVPITSDISRWDVSSVTDMTQMFDGAAFFNHNLTGWNVAAVSQCRSFAINNNQLTLDRQPNFPVSADCAPFMRHSNGFTLVAKPGFPAGSQGKLEGVIYTLVDRSLLRTKIADNEDLTRVVTTGIVDMADLFATNQANPDIRSWDTSSVTRMRDMFRNSNFNQDISGWDVSQVTNMQDMFQHAPDFNQDISRWDVSSVTIMVRMFAVNHETLSSFNQDISRWDTSSVVDCRQIFLGIFPDMPWRAMHRPQFSTPCGTLN